MTDQLTDEEYQAAVRVEAALVGKPCLNCQGAKTLPVGYAVYQTCEVCQGMGDLSKAIDALAQRVQLTRDSGESDLAFCQRIIRDTGPLSNGIFDSQVRRSIRMLANLWLREYEK